MSTKTDDLQLITRVTAFIKSCINMVLQQQEPRDDKPIDNATLIKDVDLVDVPVVDEAVRAGYPIMMDNNVWPDVQKVPRWMCRHPESSVMMRVKGDSMVGAGILDGDYVVIDKSLRNPAANEVAFCEYDGGYTIKYFHVDDDGKHGSPRTRASASGAPSQPTRTSTYTSIASS